MFQGFSTPHMDGFTMLGLDVESSSWHDGFILVYVIEVVLIVIEWDMRYWIVHLIVVNFHLNNLSNLSKRIDTKALWKKCDQAPFSPSVAKGASLSLF
jgi:hypothetical protein